jgi:hypothetical protein
MNWISVQYLRQSGEWNGADIAELSQQRVYRNYVHHSMAREVHQRGCNEGIASKVRWIFNPSFVRFCELICMDIVSIRQDKL